MFTGDVDLVSLRAALMSLDGDRTPSGVPVSSPGPVQAIPKAIHDGMPDQLKAAAGLPTGPAPAAGVPVPSDGVATVLDVAERAVPPQVGFLQTHLLTGPNGSARFARNENCS